MQIAPVTLGLATRSCRTAGFVLTEGAYAPLTSLSRHRHERATLSFAVSGSFVEATDDATLACEELDLIAKPPLEEHSNRFGQNGARLVMVEFTAERLESVLPFTHIFDHARQIPGRGVIPIIASRLHREMERHDEASLLAMEGLVLELLAEASRPADPPRHSRAFSAAEEFLRRNWQESLSVAQIAEAAGVHPATLVRLFRAHRNCSPGEYLRQLRIAHAARELSRSTRCIAEIAVEAGFYDQSHFTNAFKRQIGVTPAQYRRQSGN
jgi:AraC family transcriptional regulator